MRINPGSAAGNLAGGVDEVVFGLRPVAPDHLPAVARIETLGFELRLRERKRERPVAFIDHRLHEFVGDQQRQVELAQASVLALGFDEVEDVRVTDIESRHLRTAASPGGGYGEAHAVVDIHERQGPGSLRAGARYVGAARAQGRKLVADAGAGLERIAGFMQLAQYAVHGVVDGIRHRAIDGRGRGLVRLCTGVGDDAASRDSAVLQSP